MSRKKKREEEAAVAAGFGDPVGGSVAAPSIGRVTPIDIQQKSFGKTVMRRGYNEREVDQFLDEVTEELARQLAENKSVREQLQQAEMRATTPLGSGAADADAVVRQARAEAARILAGARDDAAHVVAEARGEAVAILEAAHGEAGTVPRPAGEHAAAAGPGSPGSVGPDRDFIHREREFLQKLAELIQGHAEAIREDLKRVRETAPRSDDGGSGASDDARGADPEAPFAGGGPGPDDASGGSSAGADGPAVASAVFVAAGEASVERSPERSTMAEGSSDASAAWEPAAASVVPAHERVDEGDDVHVRPDASAPADAPTDVAAPHEEAGDRLAVAEGAPAEHAPPERAQAPDATAGPDVGPDGADDERAGDGAPAETVTAPAGSEPVPAILDLTAGEQGQEPRDEASEVQVITTPEDDEAREHPAEPAAVGVAASVSTGSFGRWMEETSQGPAGSEPEDAPEAESESDGRSLRELFWGED